MKKYKILLSTTILVLFSSLFLSAKNDNPSIVSRYRSVSTDLIEMQLQDRLHIGKDTDSVYIIVEEMPEFPGGTDSLMRYIAYHVKYPPVDENVVGHVSVRFIIEKDGSIGHAEIIRGIDRRFDEEALRVVRGMPRWKPGRDQGKAVRVRYTMPVRFKYAK